MKTKCQVCGVKWKHHHGMTLTCAAKQKAQDKLAVAMETLDQIAVLPRAGRAKRLASSAATLLRAL